MTYCLNNGGKTSCSTIPQFTLKSTRDVEADDVIGIGFSSSSNVDHFNLDDIPLKCINTSLSR